MSVLLKNIKLLRSERDISQQKLAEVIGMTASSINDYENRKIEPDITTLKRMADYFETSVDYIVGHTHIRRKIEEGDEFVLNGQEAALVRGYRKIPASSRKILDDLISDMQKR
jgi:transcriptional regulator with XRE-family HTH domain